MSKDKNESYTKKARKWKPWHQREALVQIKGQNTPKGVQITISCSQLTTDLEIHYPNSIWKNYPSQNKFKLIDNITYVFTAHLPFLLKGNIHLSYNTGYPHSYSWANQCFTRYLPAYWYLYKGKRGTKIFPLLKTILNSQSDFAQTADTPPQFPSTKDENIIIPFTFGKDSFLTYYLTKEIGLNPTLVYFNEPTETYARDHKLKLIDKFSKFQKQKVHYVENPLGSLREYGEGWFGWELSLTSWALLSLPFAYHKKAGYIIFSNESSCNDFFYDNDNIKVVPDYEQSGQATEELSLLTQSLSEGEVYTTSFLQGLQEIAIIAILKDRYPQSLKYLMSCWAETEAAKNKRWCANCTKCARIYLYLCANGIDPQKQAGFQNNLFQLEHKTLYNIFGEKASGTGFDAFGTNYQEQLLAFYLTSLRKNKSPLIKYFNTSPAYKKAKNLFPSLVNQFFSLKKEHITPPQWKDKIDTILSSSLQKTKSQLLSLA